MNVHQIIDEEITEKMKGKTVEEAAFTKYCAVIKFTDGTFLDLYVASNKANLKVSTINDNI